MNLIYRVKLCIHQLFLLQINCLSWKENPVYTLSCTASRQQLKMFSLMLVKQVLILYKSRQSAYSVAYSAEWIIPVLPRVAHRC